MSATLERVRDHVDQGLARLITEYRDKPRLAAWAGAYLRQVQLLEDAIWDVIIKRMIDTATSEQLRVIGRIVGELPENDDDETFRIMIYARIRINRSRGNIDDVFAVLTLISETPVFFTEFRPACIFLLMLAVPDLDPVRIYSKLHDTKAGGVKLTLIVPTTNTHAFLPMSVGEVSNPLHACGDASVTKAAITSGEAEPYALEDGMTLNVTVDGEAQTPIVFREADFDDIAAATAEEVIDVLYREARRAFLASGTTDITLTAHRAGDDHTIQVTGGTANAIFDFDTSEEEGTGDTTYGLLSDVVTVRSPLADPPFVAGPPIIAFVDPDEIEE